MAGTRITKVRLLNVPLEKDYKNTLYFASKNAQESYFESKIVKNYTNFSYQRKDSYIRVPDHFDNLQNVNYVMYQNSEYSNKWFYAFITDIKYIDDGRTDIYIETDYIQTWLFDYTVKHSFVEREHVSDDTVGIHTVPENVELGGYITDSRVDGKNLFSTTEVIVGATIDLSQYETGITKDEYPDIAGSKVGGIYSGLKYYLFNNTNSLNTMLKNVAKAGKSDGIVCLFMGNSDFFDTTAIEGKMYSEITESFTAKVKEFDYTIAEGGAYTSITTPSKPTMLNGYTPNNKKLLTYPYCYLYVTNNVGSSAIYRFEYFSGNKTEFNYSGTVAPGMSIRFRPLNYNNQAINNDEGITCAKLPICSWNTDVFTNWLTQNSINLGVSLFSDTMSIVGGAISGGAIGGGLAVSGASGIANTIGTVYQHSLMPPQIEGEINGADSIASGGFSRISLMTKTIKREYAEIIDKYFDMFGYKVNMLKIPNTNHRSRYWFTKTIDVNIDGAIPNKDMEVIKSAYNNGITFWRNGDDIQNYGLPNPII